jgi:hypothetical protein
MSSLLELPGRAEPDEETLDVSVVLPCFNERDSVGLCIPEALQALGDAGLTGEVLVVDNNSTDGSAEVAAAAGARVIFERRKGYGAALAAGIDAAKGRIVVMADADCTYPLDRLAQIIAPVLDGTHDLVLGARMSQANRHSMPILHRLIGSPVLTYLLRQSAGRMPVTDSQSGFRAFRRSTIVDLDLKSSGMEFASEMLIRAGQRNMRIEEVDLGYRPRVGESKLDTWRDGLRHLRLIFSLNPHLALWQVGTTASVLGMAATIIGALHPQGLVVGSLVWQPIFFSSILILLGLLGLLSGALLAFHAPTSAPAVRRAFSWIADPSFHRAVLGVAIVLGGAGVAVDAALFAAWVTGGTANNLQRVELAGFAQSMIIGAGILFAFRWGYPLVRRLGHAEPDRSP